MCQHHSQKPVNSCMFLIYRARFDWDIGCKDDVTVDVPAQKKKKKKKIHICLFYKAYIMFFV